MKRSIEEINEKIKNKKATIVRADEMTKLVKEQGYKNAFRKVDVVTTGTFGAMCSSGVFFNFNHFDPPAKLQNSYLNGVNAYGGIASADIYIGATQTSNDRERYGGAHVIEELIKGNTVNLRSTAIPTHCYPCEKIDHPFTLKDLNQAIMLNPRNGYQKYNGAVNMGEDILYTYMGKLLPLMGNVNYSGSGELNPLMNDPDFETIGAGSKIFIGGDLGMIVGSGTQHDPENDFSTLMITGNLKQMSDKYVKAAYIRGYGSTLYLGIGLPIPVLNCDIANKTGISDEEININILDFSIESNKRPVIAKTDYRELRSGILNINGKKVRTKSLSSHFLSIKIAEHIKTMVTDGKFRITSPPNGL